MVLTNLFMSTKISSNLSGLKFYLSDRCNWRWPSVCCCRRRRCCQTWPRIQSPFRSRWRSTSRDPTSRSEADSAAWRSDPWRWRSGHDPPLTASRSRRFRGGSRERKVRRKDWLRFPTKDWEQTGTFSRREPFWCERCCTGTCTTGWLTSWRKLTPCSNCPAVKEGENCFIRTQFSCSNIIYYHLL